MGREASLRRFGKIPFSPEPNVQPTPAERAGVKRPRRYKSPRHAPQPTDAQALCRRPLDPASEDGTFRPRPPRVVVGSSLPHHGSTPSFFLLPDRLRRPRLECCCRNSARAKATGALGFQRPISQAWSESVVTGMPASRVGGAGVKPDPDHVTGAGRGAEEVRKVVREDVAVTPARREMARVYWAFPVPQACCSKYHFHWY
jgi:hypothetical protein